MGRTGALICDDCNVYQYNGYGSYSSWLDFCKSVEEFDAEVEKSPSFGELNKNKNVRAFLEAHPGHEISLLSCDTWYTDEDQRLEEERVESATQVQAPFPT